MLTLKLSKTELGIGDDGGGSGSDTGNNTALDKRYRHRYGVQKRLSRPAAN